MALNIRRALQAREMSVKEMAERMGISPSALNASLRSGAFSLRFLKRVADILDCDIVELFDEPKAYVIKPLPPEQDTFKAGSPLALSVKRAIKSCGMNLVDVAAKMGVTAASLSAAINGSPKLHTLESIADVLICDVVELFPQPKERRLPCIETYEEAMLRKRREKQAFLMQYNSHAQSYRHYRTLKTNSVENG